MTKWKCQELMDYYCERFPDLFCHEPVSRKFPNGGYAFNPAFYNHWSQKAFRCYDRLSRFAAYLLQFCGAARTAKKLKDLTFKWSDAWSMRFHKGYREWRTTPYPAHLQKHLDEYSSSQYVPPVDKPRNIRYNVVAQILNP